MANLRANFTIISKIMTSRFFSLFLFLSCVSTSVIYLVVCTPPLAARQTLASLSTEAILEKAKLVTVKVKVGKTTGSGILIERKGQVYTVLTNRHVVNHGKTYQIQTLEGDSYEAKLIARGEKNDLAILEFRSDRNHETAPLSSSLRGGDRVFAVGFPFDRDELILSAGQFSLKPNLPLQHGYQLGYTSQIQAGMSGGPIFNSAGEVIGINGRSANPILPNYQFQDGSFPNEEQQQQMMSLSWGLPIENLAEVLPSVASAFSSDSHSLEAEKSSVKNTVKNNTESQLEEAETEEEREEIPKLKGIPKSINKIAEKITVRIDSPDSNGSGVIFARDGDNYYVVTAKHVVKDELDYQIITEDEKVYEINSSEIQRFENSDLAIVSFTSKKNYQVAAFSNYDLGLNNEFWVFVYGWAKFEAEPEPYLTVGKVAGKETGIFLVKDDGSFDETRGNELVYTNLSARGMSGGPVLDTNGRVIGIHTSAEGERYRLTNRLQLGFSLGVPIGTFLESEKLQLLTQSHNLEIQTIKERADIVPFFRPNLSQESLDSIPTNILKSPDSKGSEAEWVNYGNQLWRISRYLEAVEAYDKAIAKETNLYQAYYGKGLALYDLGNYEDASQAFGRAIDLKPDFYPAWYRQSLSLLNMRRYSQALSTIEKTIALKPENTILYALKGEALQNLSQYDEAISSYNRAIAKTNNSLILTRRSSIYRILGKYDLSLKDLDRAIKYDPRYTEGYINRSLTYYQLGDYQQALINLNHVIGSIDRQEPRAFLARGFVYQKLEEKSQAQADFVRAFNLYSQEKTLEEEGNEINLQANRYNQLNTDFDHFMQLDTVEPNIHFGRGVTYLLLDNKQQAIDSFNQAQELFQTQQDEFGRDWTEKIIVQISEDLSATK